MGEISLSSDWVKYTWYGHDSYSKTHMFMCLHTCMCVQVIHTYLCTKYYYSTHSDTGPKELEVPKITYYYHCPTRNTFICI